MYTYIGNIYMCTYIEVKIRQRIRKKKQGRIDSYPQYICPWISWSLHISLQTVVTNWHWAEHSSLLSETDHIFKTFFSPLPGGEQKVVSWDTECHVTEMKRILPFLSELSSEFCIFFTTLHVAYKALCVHGVFAYWKSISKTDNESNWGL